MPEWKKVESPTMPTTLRGSPAFVMPCAMEMPAAHAEDRVQPVQRRERAEAVAADVAGHDHVELAEGVEDAAVRAARAQHRRPGGQVRRLGRRGRLGDERRGCSLGGIASSGARQAAQHGGQARRRQLADAGHQAPALAGDAQGPDVLLEDVVQLLDDEHLLARPAANSRISSSGNGMAQPSFSTEAPGQHLPHVLVGDALGDDAEAAVAPTRSGSAGLASAAAASAAARSSTRSRIARACAGHRHEPLEVLLEPDLPVGRLPLAERRRRPGVADPGRGAQEHGRAEPLGDLEAEHREVLGLLGVGGLEHRDLGEPGVVPGVLLVLRGVHAGVVGHDDHQPAHRRPM